MIGKEEDGQEGVGCPGGTAYRSSPREHRRHSTASPHLPLLRVEPFWLGTWAAQFGNMIPRKFSPQYGRLAALTWPTGPGHT